MIRMLAVLVVLFTAFANVEVQKPLRLSSSKIINGFPINISQVPSQVSIVKNGKFSCGGSIISPLHILSAAHCFQNITADKIYIRSGSNQVKANGVVTKVKTITTHPLYDKEYRVDYDISILTLRKELKFDELTQPVLLGKLEAPMGSRALVCGWGSLALQGPYPKQLQGVFLDLIDRESCNEQFQALGSKLVITPRMICTYTPRKDACRGDSGGPLFVNKILVGIVSFGLACDYSPGVYANVPVLKNFIDEVTKNSAKWAE